MNRVYNYYLIIELVYYLKLTKTPVNNESIYLKYVVILVCFIDFKRR